MGEFHWCFSEVWPELKSRSERRAADQSASRCVFGSTSLVEDRASLDWASVTYEKLKAIFVASERYHWSIHQPGSSLAQCENLPQPPISPSQRLLWLVMDGCNKDYIGVQCGAQQAWWDTGASRIFQVRCQLWTILDTLLEIFSLPEQNNKVIP